MEAPDLADVGLESSPDFEQLWHSICRILPEPELQHVVWYSFVQGYKPEALLAEFPDIYPDADTVRVRKQKAMRRLRKDAVLRRWFGLPPDDL